ncbi:alpha-glucuronidase [Brachybacterium sp. GCM10030267]|uniref:alpha-glucuronidase n=1 Tax=Brachybacterium sp. GCM10030267 TaxID=3273381 RepID=UPI0036117BDE
MNHTDQSDLAAPVDRFDHDRPVGADLAWLGAHAAARLPGTVEFHADGGLVPTLQAEVARLRALAPSGRPAAVLHLHEAAGARDSGVPDGTAAPADPGASDEATAGTQNEFVDVLAELAAAGPEAFALRSAPERIDVIGGGERGLLYGFYATLLAAPPEPTSSAGAGQWEIHAPRHAIRMLDHWDNLEVHPVMGQVERGYAGGSLFYEDGELRADLGRVEHYARLLASIGINRVAINNVNVHARETTLLTERLDSVARLASIFRAHGIATFLSVSFASPMVLGGVETADPLDPAVQRWWERAAGDVYEAIPDFGGFVVKADSEGQPGPFAYGRHHADGANMLGRALAPHGGEVFWRAFVYNHRQDWRDRSTDRARAAHDHFAPLDGAFDDNVVLQVKHGPLDFQTREPISPVLGAMPCTRLAVEFQVTQEYTGQQKHICYLAPWWRENLNFRFGDSSAPTVSDLVARGRGGVVAVSNVGADEFWTGHPLAQANLFALGRQAWDPTASPTGILEEWIRATFGPAPEVSEVLHDLMDASWQLYESYTAPLGVGFMVRPGHHYGPDVDGYEYTPWGTYHFADRDGIGVDRTVATGTGYAGLYPEPWASTYEDPSTCPDELLLFFHHVSYTHRLRSGKTVIQHIYDSRADGYERVLRLRPRWQELAGKVPSELHDRVDELLGEQERSALEWRDQLRTYFFRASGIPDASGRPTY